MTNADDAMLGMEVDFLRSSVEAKLIKPIYVGDAVRDWSSPDFSYVLFPYLKNQELVNIREYQGLYRWMWRARTILGNRATFNKETYFTEGRPWWEWHQVTLERLRTPLSITFAEVATHNHFVLDRGGKVFKQTAPVIKLPTDATEADHLALLGLLNSSTACSWIKQIIHCKGSTVDTKGARQTTVAFENFYQIACTGLKQFPIPTDPNHAARNLAIQLDQLAQQLAALDPAAVLADAPEDPAAALAAAKSQTNALIRRMIALQEELDWCNYRLYGLTDADLCMAGSPGEPAPELELDQGERPFEIALARRVAAGETESTWFARHGSRPRTDLPAHWPADYRALTERRLRAIADNRWIRLVEQPEYKRRWNREPWDKQRQEDAIDARAALDPADPASLTPAQAQALKAEQVGAIPLPPKYAAADFRQPSYWGLRGKLDVPKERFFSLPGCEKAGDNSLVIGWAGLNHLQRAQAIAAWYLARKEQEGWDAERLTPMLLALDELIPWLKQWHNEIDPDYGERLGDFYEGFLLEELRQLERSRDDLSGWQPPAARRGRRLAPVSDVLW